MHLSRAACATTCVSTVNAPVRPRLPLEHDRCVSPYHGGGLKTESDASSVGSHRRSTLPAGQFLSGYRVNDILCDLNSERNRS